MFMIQIKQDKTIPQQKKIASKTIMASVKAKPTLHHMYKQVSKLGKTVS